MKSDDRNGSMALWLEVFVRILGTKTEDISLLDLCCGRMGNTGTLKFRDSLHVDVTDYDERPRGYRFERMDVLKLPDSLNGKYEVCLCSDGIEHLSKSEGCELIKRMEQLSNKRIIFTPLGEYMVDPNAGPEGHRSGWLASDFPPNWDTQEFPNWHPTLGIGSIWAWSSN